MRERQYALRHRSPFEAPLCGRREGGNPFACHHVTQSVVSPSTCLDPASPRPGSRESRCSFMSKLSKLTRQDKLDNLAITGHAARLWAERGPRRRGAQQLDVAPGAKREFEHPVPWASLSASEQCASPLSAFDITKYDTSPRETRVALASKNRKNTPCTVRNRAPGAIGFLAAVVTGSRGRAGETPAVRLVHRPVCHFPDALPRVARRTLAVRARRCRYSASTILAMMLRWISFEPP